MKLHLIVLAVLIVINSKTIEYDWNKETISILSVSSSKVAKNTYTQLLKTNEENGNKTCKDTLLDYKTKGVEIFYYQKLYSGSFSENIGDQELCLGMNKVFEKSFSFYLLEETYFPYSKKFKKIHFGICLIEECKDIYKTYYFKLFNVTEASSKIYELRKYESIEHDTIDNVIRYIVLSYIFLFIMSNLYLLFLDFSYNPYKREIFKNEIVYNAHFNELNHIKEENKNDSSSIFDSLISNQSNVNNTKVDDMKEITFHINTNNNINVDGFTYNDSSFRNTPNYNRESNNKFISIDSIENPQNMISYYKKLIFYFFSMKNNIYVLTNEKCKIFEEQNNEKINTINGMIGFFFFFHIILETYKEIFSFSKENELDYSNIEFINPISLENFINISTSYNETFILLIGIKFAIKSFNNKIESSYCKLFKKTIQILIVPFVLLIIFKYFFSFFIKSSNIFLYLLVEGLGFNIFNKIIPFYSVTTFNSTKYKSSISFYFVFYHFNAYFLTFYLNKYFQKSTKKIYILSFLIVFTLIIKFFVIWIFTDYRNIFSYDYNNISITNTHINIFTEAYIEFTKNFIFCLPNFFVGYLIGIIIWMDNPKGIIDIKSTFNCYFYGFTKIIMFVEHWLWNKILLIFSIISFLFLLNFSNLVVYLNKSTNINLFYLFGIYGFLFPLIIGIILICILHTSEPFTRVNILYEELISSIIKSLIEIRLFSFTGRNINILNYSYKYVINFLLVTTISYKISLNKILIVFFYGFPCFCFCIIITFIIQTIFTIPIKLMFIIKDFYDAKAIE